MKKIHYTTRGPVRGSCGHKHRTIDSACRCQLKDQKDCASMRGYSDRSVYAVEDGERRELTRVEHDLVCHILDSIALR